MAENWGLIEMFATVADLIASAVASLVIALLGDVSWSGSGVAVVHGLLACMCILCFAYVY